MKRTNNNLDEKRGTQKQYHAAVVVAQRPFRELVHQSAGVHDIAESNSVKSSGYKLRTNAAGDAAAAAIHVRHSQIIPFSPT